MNSQVIIHLPERVGWTLLHSLWQFALISVVLLLLLRLLKRRSSAQRYLTECVALALMVVAPIATVCFVDVQSDQAPTAATAGIDAEPVESSLSTPDGSTPDRANKQHSIDISPSGRRAEAVPSVRSPAAATQHETASHQTAARHARWRESIAALFQPWLREIFVGWVVGIALLSVRPMIGWRGARQLRRLGVSDVAGEVVDIVRQLSKRIGVLRVTRVVESTLVDVPTVIGWVRPLILLPASSLTGLTREQLEAVLAHELAHIRRHDYLVNMIQLLAETVLFYHPAIWWVSHRMRIEREECCDDIAVRLTGDRAGYARLLVWLDETRGRNAASVTALTAVGGSLLHRVRRIMRPQSGSGAGTGLLVLVLLGTVLTSGGVWLSASTAGESEGGETPGSDVSVIDTQMSFAEAISRQFADSLAMRELPYLHAKQVQVFQRELHGYLSQRIDDDVTSEKQTVGIEAVRHWTQRLSSTSRAYLGFRGDFDMLGWQLWTFADRKYLTPDELQRRELQRGWMRDYISGLPAPASDVEKWQHAARLDTVETEVFSNPLSPFFHTPMTDEQFAEFQQRLKDRQGRVGRNRLVYVPAHILLSAVQTRVAALREQYPPGFPVGGLSIGGTTHFAFRAAVFPDDVRYWLTDELPPLEKRCYDAERNIATDVPEDLQPGGLEGWLDNHGVDLRYDAQTGRLLPVGRAKLALLDDTEWYELDQVPTVRLRERVRSQPVTGFDVGSVGQPNDLLDVNEKLARLPTGILVSDGGKVVLFRVGQQDLKSVHVFFRPRPLPPAPPFHQGSGEQPEAPADEKAAISGQIPGSQETQDKLNSPEEQKPQPDGLRDDQRSSRVIDVSGAPIAGATVAFQTKRAFRWNPPPTPMATTVTDEQGRFQYPESLSELNPFYVYVNADGFLQRDWTATRDIFRKVDGVRQPDKMTLLRPVTISGRILDEKGQPLPDADMAVDYFMKNGPANINGNRVTSDATGRFTANNVPPANVFVRYEPPYKTIDQRMPVNVQPARLCIVHLTPEDGATVDDVVLDLRLTNCVLNGRVVDEDGNGVFGRSVRATYAAAAGRLDESVRVKTNAAGNFWFEGLTADDFVVSVEPAGSSQTVRLSPDKPANVTLHTFVTGSEPAPEQSQTTWWGQPNKHGLRAGLRLDPPQDSISIGEVVDVEVVIGNPGDGWKMFKCSFSEQANLQVTDDAGQVVTDLNYGNFSGWRVITQYRLEPGHVAQVGSFQAGFTAAEDPKDSPPAAMFRIPCERGEKLRIQCDLSAEVSAGTYRNSDMPTAAWLTGKAEIAVE